jgi:hypothetical protein
LKKRWAEQDPTTASRMVQPKPGSKGRPRKAPCDRVLKIMGRFSSPSAAANGCSSYSNSA